MRRAPFAILFIILLIITLIGYTGCSSSTYTSRYDRESKKEDSDSHQRFSDKENFTDVEDSILEDEDQIPEDPGIDITSVMSHFNTNSNATDLNTDNGTLKEKMLMEIIKYLNTPYKFGGNSVNGIDCSAFTQTIYHNILSVELNRSAREQFQQGTEIDNREDLKFGDLVFFNTRRRVKPGHVGIYIGDNLFAHASFRNGVIVSSMDKDYYSNRFMGGRRVEKEDIF